MFGSFIFEVCDDQAEEIAVVGCPANHCLHSAKTAQVSLSIRQEVRTTAAFSSDCPETPGDIEFWVLLFKNVPGTLECFI